MTEEGSSNPEIIVTMTGDLILNARAFAMLGEPCDVTLLYSRDRHLVGIRAGGRFPVTRLEAGNLWKIGKKAFWRRIGLVITETASYEPMCWPVCTRDGTLIGGSALFIDISDLVKESEAFRELFLETPEQYREAKTPMAEQDWSALYGPPATDTHYAVGETLIYDDAGTVENGEILYAAATNPQTGEPDLHYIVSPAGSGFPSPVWPCQIIAGMP